MTFTQNQIKALNNMSVAAQNAKLGDVIAELQASSGGNKVQKVISKLEESLEAANTQFAEIENKLNAEIANNLKAVSETTKNQLSEVENRLNVEIGESKTDISVLKEEISLLRDEINGLTVSLGATNDKVDDLLTRPSAEVSAT